ncbi:1242_t:CDS:2 [Diversispora eburnea]|uniref:1242_t:CDS:1 n=1 Tax=Diversispora eburnea TaxID=1213867 RepID=A0A9N9FK68_9GLOM|nr:1242_t:CDS:2 [Diversispora eburnea]
MEIAIPVDQLQKFQYTSERFLVLAFKENFVRIYNEFPHDNLDYRIQIPNDPSQGQLDEVNKIIFSFDDSVEDKTVHKLAREIKNWPNKSGLTPLNLLNGRNVQNLNFHSNNLTRENSNLSTMSLLDTDVGDELKDFKPLLQPSNVQKLPSQLSSISSSDQSDVRTFQNGETDGMSEFSDVTPPDNDELIHVTCSFLTRKYAMLIPHDRTLKDLINEIEQTRNTKISLNRLFYKNQVNDKIDIVDDDDWKIAKKEARISKINMITLLFA